MCYQYCRGTSLSSVHVLFCIRGKLQDTVLDWEDELPVGEMKKAEYHSNKSDLSLCLGTSLQILPSASLPLKVHKPEKGKLVICNLQPTKYVSDTELLYIVETVLILFWGVVVHVF